MTTKSFKAAFAATEARDATLKRDLKEIVTPHQRGDPESPLIWTSKSLRKLAAELKKVGRPRYPHAHSLLITADEDGSNGSHNRLWKTALQRFADEAE